jgi:single-stranded DNA-binding protein
MFRFSFQGRLGRIEEVKNTPDIVRLSLAADRLADGQWTKTEWVSAISFDRALNETMLTELEKGQSVTIEGRVEPRKRKLGETTIYDTSFVITRFERLSKPKAKPQPVEAAA